MLDNETIAERILQAQAELQTALGFYRLDRRERESLDPDIEMRLQACLSMLHTLMDDLGRPMYNPTQMPEGWTPA